MSVAAKRMTRGGSDTDLEPSEEFPILFGLLTAPMTNSSSAGGAGGGSIPKSSSAFLSKYFRKAEPAPNEPDSSALSDDDVCMSDEDDDDEDDYTSYTDTDDEDEGSKNDDEAVVSSNSHDHHHHHHCPNPFGLASEELPSSTTVDDEDYDDIIHASSRTQGMDIRLLPNNPLTKALKRSYRLMNSGESRSAGNVHDDTEDQVGFCCKNYDLENLGEIERNRLASQPSKGSSPRRMSAVEDHLAAFLHLPNKHSPHNGFGNEDDDINSEILLIQPAKKLRPADEAQEEEDSSRSSTSPVDHETSSSFSSLNPTSEMCAGFSFCNEKLRPSTTTTRQKVAQANPDFVNNASSIKSFNSITTIAVVPDNTSMNALSFNNNNNNNNNATATRIPRPKKQQVEQVRHHPTDHDHLTVPYPLERIITTATSNTSLKDSQSHNKGPSQKDHDLELPEEVTRSSNSSSSSSHSSQSYKCIHCDLTFEERQEWASHSCINN